jgi:hypothetical protein
MRLSVLALAASALLLVAPAARSATAAPAAAPVTMPSLVKSFMIPAKGLGTVGDWAALDKIKAVTWAPGPTMQDKPTPDGSYFVRLGRGMIGGRPLDVLATGARSGVFYVYIRDPGATANADATAAEFKQAGYGVTLARCPVNPQAANAKRWFKLTAPGKAPAFLSVGQLVSGVAGYTLFLADDKLAPLTPKEAPVYTDNCAGR